MLFLSHDGQIRYAFYDMYWSKSDENSSWDTYYSEIPNVSSFLHDRWQWDYAPLNITCCPNKYDELDDPTYEGVSSNTDIAIQLLKMQEAASHTTDSAILQDIPAKNVTLGTRATLDVNLFEHSIRLMVDYWPETITGFTKKGTDSYVHFPMTLGVRSYLKGLVLVPN